MANLSIDPRQALQYSCRRYTVTLFKEFLTLLEKLADEHDETLAKLAAALPPEYRDRLALADYFTMDKAERLRKEVLGRGNDCARSIDEEIQKYEIDFRQ